MLFSSMVFLWIFLPIVLLGSWVLPSKLVNPFLVVMSLFFYAWGEPVYVLIMLVSIVVNYVGGVLIERTQPAAARKAILAVDVAINLLLLFCFKYLGLFFETLNSAAAFILGSGTELFAVPQIALPIGISFFTFQGLSYVVDVYRKEVYAQKNPMYVALYISFFPQLIAGPIVRYRDIYEQIENRHTTTEQFSEGIRRFIYGLSKKVLISNVLAECVDKLYAVEISTQMDGLMAWCAAIMYAFQIYYDFSGYSDMAIGLGKMFGFEFAENFNYPYLSRSIREFWRRWHISLSTWFREYVYIPLGGNRKGTVRTYINLLIVFFLTGIWHGAGYGFVIWGLYHGFFSIIERVGFEKILKKIPIISQIYLLLVVLIGWVFFRVENLMDALFAIKRMLLPWQYAVDSTLREYVTPHALLIAVCAFLGMGIIQRCLKRLKLYEKLRMSGVEVVYLMILFILSISALASNTYNPFIYFKF